MIYTAKVVPYRDGLSKLSGDQTPLVCASCGGYVHQLLTVPGAQIGRGGKSYRVVRCLNCYFVGPYCVQFGEDGEPREITGDIAESVGLLASRTIGPRPASLSWKAGPPPPDYDGSPTFAGGNPDWLQDEEEAICPSCDKPMEFILQLSSMTMDGWRDGSGNPLLHDRWPQELGYDFHMNIEHYSTLYFFSCEECRMTCSLTQCT